ncbi:AraC family transcriptional regulator [Salinicola sp. DM10]|uniref:AraC family transcriptional regulator n=1 Tax=Salinicola sp. DM10 TaxID=2815721 RepID=UPI001A8ED5DC|nr:AraC family transcriptional regulator [Salinicola sp. DM10]
MQLYRIGELAAPVRQEGTAANARALRQELVELLDRLTRGRQGKLPTAIPGLCINRLDAPQPPRHVIHDPVFSVIAQGAKRLAVGEALFEYDPMHSLLAAVDMPVLAEVTQASRERPYLGLRLDLDLECIGELLRDPGLPAIAARETAGGLSVSALETPLLEACVRLLRLLETPADIPVLAPMLRREIFYRLLRGEQGARLAQIASQESHAHRVAAAVRRLREGYAEPLTIAELAAGVHMSVSAFHYHFKALTAMSPLQYQKRLRLQEARRLLLGEDLEVTLAAQRVGYASLSQFSREYRRCFGLSAQQDRQRWRRGEPGQSAGAAAPR